MLGPLFSPWWRMRLLFFAIASLYLPILGIVVVLVRNPQGTSVFGWIFMPTILYLLQFSSVVFLARFVLPRDVKREWELRKFIAKEQAPPPLGLTQSLAMAGAVMGVSLAIVLALEANAIGFVLLTAVLHTATRRIIERIRRRRTESRTNGAFVPDAPPSPRVRWSTRQRGARVDRTSVPF